ncbi:hypothetical protein [Fontibacillus sp. BL9]|uniref:hypothetical protein n=1 Tax=Fontibacillus sp. BL9 TaxID=3389971 RepID=UPI00397BBFFE
MASHINLLNRKPNQFLDSPLKACGWWASDICGTDPDGCGAWSNDCCSVSDGGACGLGAYDCTDANG